MANWMSVVRCKKCNKIYSEKVPEICEKCGVLISTDDFHNMKYKKQIELAENAEFVTARRKFFGWEILKK